MNVKAKILCMLIILLLLNIYLGVFAAADDGIVKLLSIGVSELTQQRLTMQIKATGPVQYQKPVRQEISPEITIFYVDMPDTHSYIDGGGVAEITPFIPSNLSVDVPVTKIRLSQFSFKPPVSRVVFYLKQPIEPTITVKSNSLLFTFPIAPAQKPQNESTSEVKGIDEKDGPAVITQIKPDFEANATKLHIISDKQLNFKQVVSEKNPPYADIEAILELDFVNTTSSLPKDIPLQRKSVIRKVTLDSDKGSTPSCKIIIQLAKRVFYDISNIDNGIQISFENPFLERIVTIRCDNESLSKLLFTLFKYYNANIIVDKDVNTNQPVTFNLENVPLKVALDEILGSLGYTYEKADGGILRIVTESQQSEVSPAKVSEASSKPKKLATKSFMLRHASVSKLREVMQPLISEDGKIIDDERTKSIIIMDTPESLTALGDTLDKIVSELDKEAPEEVKLLEQSDTPEIKIIKRVIKLNYADPEELKKILTPLLSQMGQIESIGKSKSGETGGKSGGTGGTGGSGAAEAVGQGGYIIVTDIPEIVSQIEAEIAKIDIPIPQVEIQAYIVEGTLSDEIEAGVDWSWMREKTKTEISANALGTEKSAGTLRLKYGNLPAAEFTAVLTALSTKSDTKLLSSPRITVLENNQAKFHSGDQIGFSKVTIQDRIQTVETVFQDVGIELTVSPQVKANDIISLLINVQVSDLGEVTPTGEPTISDRSAQTQILVRNGDTAVIGGLTSDRIAENVKKVPVLGNIPALGRLFTYEKNTKKKTEMTLFITPRIVKTEGVNQVVME